MPLSSNRSFRRRIRPAGAGLPGWILCVLLALLFVQPVCAEEAVEYIDIRNPFLRKIPTAVPLFKNVSGGERGGMLSRRLADILAQTLAFTGYFEILDRQAFLADPRNPAVLGANIRFRNWTTIGAELLITGTVRLSGDMLETELRLFDSFKEDLIIGKRYKGVEADHVRMIRRFCGDIMLHLTGDRGVFESRIAFVSASGDKKEIYTCDFDGGGPAAVTFKNSISRYPAWSSDAAYLAFTSYQKGKPDLYIQRLADKKEIVVDRRGFQITPAWVPGKFQLAAAMSFSGDQEIYLLTGEGKIINRLTKSRGIDVSPTWSPDGKLLAFVSRRSGTPQIYIKDMASERVRRLTFEGRYNTEPSWSPKGDRIAYSSQQDGRLDIHTIDVEGRNPMRLTQNQGDNESPSWSPDGSLIAFSSTREGPSRIYVMTAFGTDQRRLLTLPGEQMDPKWSPNATEN